MEERDYYDTIEADTEGLYKEKGSKFIANAYRVDSMDEIDYYLAELKSLHPKSRHICYSYRLGISGDDYRINDDGEPSGTAGKPIYNEIRSKELSHILVAVVRYFGGTKLGASGLITAYKTAAKDALDQAKIIRIYESYNVNLFYPIEKMGILYDLLKKQDIQDIDSHYESKPYLRFSIRKSQCSDTIRQIMADYHGYVAAEIPEDFESPDLIFKINES